MTNNEACHAAASASAPAPCSTCGRYEAEITAWRAGRLAALRAEQGWLALAGLYWLSEGEHSLGAGPGVDIEFPAGAPPKIGTLRRSGDEVSLRVAPGVDARIDAHNDAAPVNESVLRSDADPQRRPDRVQLGERFTFFIIARGDRLGVRLYDHEAPERRAGPEWFDRAGFQ